MPSMIATLHILNYPEMTRKNGIILDQISPKDPAIWE
uniref:Uncharacterized protein n=1 Tax=Anguilla anguilla TaxID=7936 RepID=A0A0E9U0Q0_ANGAN